MSERWRDVFDWVGFYRVSDQGRVKSIRSGKLLSPSVTSQGYLCVHLSRPGRRISARVHRLVACAFLGLPPEGKPETNHIDGSKQNNVLQNLEWVSSRENRKHAWDTGLRTHKHLAIKRGVEQGQSKLTDVIVQEARRRHLSGDSMRSLARQYGVGAKTMRHAIKGVAWRHIELPAPPEVPRDAQTEKMV